MNKATPIIGGLLFVVILIFVFFGTGLFMISGNDITVSSSIQDAILEDGEVVSINSDYTVQTTTYDHAGVLTFVELDGIVINGYLVDLRSGKATQPPTTITTFYMAEPGTHKVILYHKFFDEGGWDVRTDIDFNCGGNKYQTVLSQGSSWYESMIKSVDCVDLEPWLIANGCIDVDDSCYIEGVPQELTVNNLKGKLGTQTEIMEFAVFGNPSDIPGLVEQPYEGEIITPPNDGDAGDFIMDNALWLIGGFLLIVGILITMIIIVFRK